eukprot:evm.model.scf_1470.2 EVM.evm.TU.scf_1470.2   scf_1470:13217-18807(-)
MGVGGIGKSWPLVVAILACLSVCAAARKQEGGEVGAPSFVAPNGTAFVASAMGLQATLWPGAGHSGRVVITQDILLDRLSFVPRLRVDSDMSVCGARRGLVVEGMEAFKMASVNATLTWCNLTYDMTFMPRGPRVETELFEVQAGGRVRYVDVDLYVSPGAFAALADAVGRRVVAGGGANATVDRDRITIAWAALPGAILERVEVRKAEAAPARRDFLSVRQSRSFARLRQARHPTLAPLLVEVEGNYSITPCLMRAINKLKGVAIRRPVTFTGAGGPNPWLLFPKTLPQGFLDVRYQVRYEGANYYNPSVRFVHLNATSPLPDTVEDAVRAMGALENVVHLQAQPGMGCPLVLKDMTVVHRCDYLRTLMKLLWVRRNEIGNKTGLVQVLNEQVRLAEYDKVEENTTTLVLRRFVGWGICAENVKLTCAPMDVVNVTLPHCLTTQTSGEETTYSDAYSEVYYEVTSSYDDVTDTSDYGVTSSDLAHSSDSVSTELEAIESAGHRNSVAKSVPEEAVAATAGALLMIIAGALAVVWNRKLSCAPGGRDLLARFCKMPGWRVGAGDERGDDEETMELGKEAGEEEGESVGMRCKSFTKESLINAITEESAGLDDTPAKIERQIAVGGCGVVYKGTWKGVPVAIKTVVFQDLEDMVSRQRQRAVLEAAISSSVAHRNIVQTYSYSFKRLEATTIQPLEKRKYPIIVKESMEGTVDWKLYIVQEFCDGGSLRECLDKRRVLDPETGQPMLGVVCQIGLEAALGMRHLHARKIIHGDLSSKNILLKTTPNDQVSLGTAKIADFGLSMRLGSLQSHISNQQAGTPFYTSPELCHQGVLSKKADVFSMGVFLWELYHSRKCYYVNKKSGVQYHPLFPKFPIICPIPYAMLCVVCISPQPENRPDFHFIVRVLKALKKQFDKGMYSNLEEVRHENMTLAEGLGRMTAADIVKIVADKVGISVAEDSGDSTSLSKENFQPQPTLDIQSMMKYPHAMFLPAQEQEAMKGSMYYSESFSRERQEGIHLCETYVAPFQCMANVTVSVDKDHNNRNNKEHINIAWSIGKSLTQSQGADVLKKDTAQARSTQGVGLPGSNSQEGSTEAGMPQQGSIEEASTQVHSAQASVPQGDSPQGARNQGGTSVAASGSFTTAKSSSVYNCCEPPAAPCAYDGTSMWKEELGGELGHRSRQANEELISRLAALRSAGPARQGLQAEADYGVQAQGWKMGSWIARRWKSGSGQWLSHSACVWNWRAVDNTIVGTPDLAATIVIEMRNDTNP